MRDLRSFIKVSEMDMSKVRVKGNENLTDN